ncbi:MAG: extracellular solute-binding protein [Oscillospiraceae bacterium]|nr:extracellular solute-binding protein [Oscillospiraceae bacterium]
MKKIILLMLIAAIIAGILISCGGNAQNSPDNNNDNKNGNENNENAENNQESDQPGDDNTPADARIEPDLPSDADFGGYTFTFLTHLYEGADWVGPLPIEIISEEENSEPINDAVFKRNLKIMEKYNINIDMIGIADERNAMNKAVKSGDDVYDAAIMFNNNVPGIVTAELLTNIENLPYIDLDKPWWDPAVNAMSIDHKNYLLAGDLLILDNEATNVLLFNKDLMGDLGIDLPYNLVKEGKWTFDVMNDMIKDTASDLNGDGQMTAYEDRWGFATYNDTFHALLVSGGGALAVKDKDDIPYMDFASEKNLAVLEKVMNLLYNPEYVLNAQAPPKGGSGGDLTKGDEIHVKGFEENRILFMWTRMRFVEFFRGMEANFGIIPLPKFDEAQEKYYSVVNPYTGVLLGVPKSASDLDRVSIILEALSAESRYTLQPAYYDVVLTRKYVRDEESEEMLDIIFNSRVYDIGSVYSFGNVFIDFINLAAKNDRNIISYYDKKIGAMEKAIDKIVNIFQSMD